MHITILSAGSRGDIQPFIALGQTLQDHGYTVRLAVPQNFIDFIRGQNLEVFPMRVDFQQMLEGQAGQQMMSSGQNMLQTMREGQRVMKDNLALLVEDVWQASQDTECLISHIGLSAITQTTAEAYQIPLICGTLQPFAPTRAFVHPLWPIRAKLGRSYNRLTGWLMNRLTWQIFQSEVNRLRQDTLKLPAQSYEEWQSALQRIPVLNAYSPHLIEYPADWPPNQHITGFWHAAASDDWQPPDDLVTFLAGGDAPLCFTLGSMVLPDPAATQAILQTAQRMTGQRAVWIGAWEMQADENTFVIDSCPYEWLFPRMGAVVHHGGGGTFAATLRAGAPSITIPFLMDQFFWGELAQRCGVGPAATPFKQLNANRLANAIYTSITDPAMRQRAEALSPHIRHENGTNQAAQVVKNTLTG